MTHLAGWCNKTAAGSSLPVYNQPIPFIKMIFCTGAKNTLFLTAVLSLILSASTSAQPNYPRTPEEARIVYTDLENFVEAYHELGANADTVAVLQTMYFDRGSAGLKEFISRHQLTPELMRDAMSESPERYALIPGLLAGITEVEALYRELMVDFSKAMPNAMYPPSYLLVGANRGIGQASLVGQLITVTRVADDRTKMRRLMVHELSHFQQAMAMGGQKYTQLYTTPDNMLGLCLREGGAEFITYLVLDEITQNAALDYIDGNEQDLKQKFLEDLETQDTDYWLWASLGQRAYPRLLGYAMGFKICKSYYEQAPDKSVALQTILQMPDEGDFVRASRYFE